MERHHFIGHDGYQTRTSTASRRKGDSPTTSPQSCTAAARASSPPESDSHRLTKVGMPCHRRLQKEDRPLLKCSSAGYATGQFGKNIWAIGRIPATVHGFDEFFGNLYHLMPRKNRNCPTTQGPEFKKKFGPRVLHACDGKEDRRLRIPAFDKKRMETIDERSLTPLGWMEKRQSGQAFFLCKLDAMHFRTHVAAKNIGKSARTLQRSHGRPRRADWSDLNKLDELGIADNTIVMYSTDNAPRTTPATAPTRRSRQKDSTGGGWRAVLHALAGQDQGGSV